MSSVFLVLGPRSLLYHMGLIPGQKTILEKEAVYSTGVVCGTVAKLNTAMNSLRAYQQIQGHAPPSLNLKSLEGIQLRIEIDLSRSRTAIALLYYYKGHNVMLHTRSDVHCEKIKMRIH